MNRRYRLIVSGTSALAAALLIAGCGDYSAPNQGSGGNGVSGSGTAGTMPGVGGSAAGTGGSAAGAGATAGTAAGSGGTEAAGAGGSVAGSGATGAAGSGGTGAAGSGGTGGDTGGTGATGGGGTGGGEPVTCDPLEPCGGAVVGTYTVVSCDLEISGDVDLTSLGLHPDCEAAPSPVTGTLSVTGTFTAKEDGTYQDDTMTTGEAEFEIAEACLFLSGTTTTCGMISGPLASVGFRNLMCVDNTETGGCTCTGGIDQDGGLGFVDVNAETAGTYTTTDSTLVTSAFGNDTEYSYCVENNKLAMTLVSTSKTGTVAGPIILQKN